MSNQTIKTLVDRVINKHHGKPITHAWLAEDMGEALKEYANRAYEAGRTEGLKEDPEYKSYQTGWKECKAKALRVATSWHDPKYPEAAGSQAAAGIKKDLKEKL